MTTKPKTRKAPAAKAATPKNGATVAPSEPRRAISEIERLVSRHKWLEADQSYRATIAATDEEEDRLLELHHDELRKIEGKLATLVPATIHDIYCLLKFATDWSHVIEGHPVDMLKNIQAVLYTVWHDEVGAEAEKARKKGFVDAQNFLFASRSTLTTGTSASARRPHDQSPSRSFRDKAGALEVAMAKAPAEAGGAEGVRGSRRF